MECSIKNVDQCTELFSISYLQNILKQYPCDMKSFLLPSQVPPHTSRALSKLCLKPRRTSEGKHELPHLENSVIPHHQKTGYCTKTIDSNESDSDTDPALQVLVTDTVTHTAGVIPGKGPPPDLPITCCMSGCANCVWLSYADELMEYYSDGGDKALEAIDKIEDPMLKAFLKMELKPKLK